MHLVDLDVRAAYGLAHPPQLRGLRPGLVLLVGPNASGKSTVGRILRGTMWPVHAPSGVDARSTWQLGAQQGRVGATLVFGRSVWDGKVPGLAPELAGVWALTLQELPRSESASDREVARAIQTQLTGGYDLSQLRPCETPRPRPTPSQSKVHKEGLAELRKLLAKTDVLELKEGQIAALQASLDEAAAAPARLHQARRALDRRRDAERLREVLAELEEVGDGVLGLPDGAHRIAEKLRDQVTKWTRDVQARRATAEATETRARSLAFQEGDPGREQLVELLATAEAVIDEDARLTELAAERSRLQGAVAAASAQVWSSSQREALPDRAVLDRLRRGVDALRDAEAVLDSLPAPEATPPAPAEAQREAWRVRRRLLRRWLGEPRDESEAARHRRRKAMFLTLGVGVLLAIGGVALFAAGLLPPAGLCGALALGCAGLALGLHWGATRFRDDGERESIRDEHDRDGASGITSWTVEAVSEALAEVEEMIRGAEAAARAVDLERERQARRVTATRRRDDCAADLAALAEELGLAADLPQLGLWAQADRVLELARQGVALAAIDAEWKAAREDLATALGRLRERMQAGGLLDDPEARSPGQLKTVLDLATARRRDWAAELEHLDGARKEQARAEDELEEACTALGLHLQACGVAVEDIGSLVLQEQRRDDARRLDDERRDLQRGIKAADSELPTDLPTDEAALGAEVVRLEALAADQQRLQEELAGTKVAIRQATEGRSIQAAIAKRDTGLDELVAARDAQLQARAGEALISWLRAASARDDAPQLLERARSWFLRFTKQRYELRVDEATGFVAFDMTSARLQRLSELSDGTRIQLLLAARLAFIEHVEGTGPRTPLFLDEILATTDRERFSAIAQAVLELTGDGRQVFYAVADPGEAAAWRAAADAGEFEAPQTVELGDSDTVQQWTPAPTFEPPPPLPSPEGLDASAYAAALGLPRPGLHGSSGAWPLPLLMFDQLDVAHVMAQAGLRTASQLSLVDRGLPVPVKAEDLELARARARLVEIVLDALRVGRGGRLTWVAVAGSGTVTAAFEDAMRELAAEHLGDPSAFVEAVRELPRFRARKADELREHLVEVGILDEGEPLEPAVVVDRALVGARDEIAAGTLRASEVEAFVRFIEDVVGV